MMVQNLKLDNQVNWQGTCLHRNSEFYFGAFQNLKQQFEAVSKGNQELLAENKRLSQIRGRDDTDTEVALANIRLANEKIQVRKKRH
jgi:ribonuclease I